MNLAGELVCHVCGTIRKEGLPFPVSYREVKPKGPIIEETSHQDPCTLTLFEYAGIHWTVSTPDNDEL